MPGMAASADIVVGKRTILSYLLSPLMKFPDGSWRKTFSFPAGTHLEYKFTRGSWNTEAVDSLGSVPSNHSLNVEEDTIIQKVFLGSSGERPWTIDNLGAGDIYLSLFKDTLQAGRSEPGDVLGTYDNAAFAHRAY